MPLSASGSALTVPRPMQALPSLNSRQGEQVKRPRNPLATLRRVSGRLRALLQRTDTNEQVAQKPFPLLIVDDEESICFSMKEYFSDNGFIVDTAKDVDEAEHLIGVANYKVIIQDLRMGTAKRPEGLEMIRMAHERNPDTRIVVLSAYGSSEVEDEAKRFGADAFLRKPQPLSQVAQVVRGLIESPRRRPAAHG